MQAHTKGANGDAGIENLNDGMDRSESKVCKLLICFLTNFLSSQHSQTLFALQVVQTAAGATGLQWMKIQLLG